jgi:hypothetical protein
VEKSSRSQSIFFKDSLLISSVELIDDSSWDFLEFRVLGNKIKLGKGNKETTKEEKIV